MHTSPVFLVSVASTFYLTHQIFPASFQDFPCNYECEVVAWQQGHSESLPKAPVFFHQKVRMSHASHTMPMWIPWKVKVGQVPIYIKEEGVMCLAALLFL